MHPRISWPNNKKFAFTIFDDTDRANLKDIQLVYEYLDTLGFKTTKSVWVIKGNRPHESSGVTCDDKMYLDWLLGLKIKDLKQGITTQLIIVPIVKKLGKV